MKKPIKIVIYLIITLLFGAFCFALGFLHGATWIEEEMPSNCKDEKNNITYYNLNADQFAFGWSQMRPKRK